MITSALLSVSAGNWALFVQRISNLLLKFGYFFFCVPLSLLRFTSTLPLWPKSRRGVCRFFLLHFEGAPFVERFYLALPNIEAHNGHLRMPLGIAVAHLSHAVCARLPCGKDPRVCVHCDWALLSVRGNQKAAESWWVKTGKSSWGRHDAIFMILYDTWIIMLHEEERKDHPLLEGFLAN